MSGTEKGGFTGGCGVGGGRTVEDSFTAAGDGCGTDDGEFTCGEGEGHTAGGQTEEGSCTAAGRAHGGTRFYRRGHTAVGHTEEGGLTSCGVDTAGGHRKEVGCTSQGGHTEEGGDTGREGGTPKKAVLQAAAGHRVIL